MLTISIENRLLADKLGEIMQEMADMKPLMSGIGQALESRVSEHFETETDPEGKPWAAWSPDYLANYPKGGNRRILDFYGDMLNNLNHKADSDSVRVGFGTLIATYHEFGTEHMPRRGLLTANPETGELAARDEAEILNIIDSWMGKMTRD